MSEKSTLLIGGGVTDKTLHRVKFNLAILNFISSIYWGSAELIFFDYLDEYSFWQKKGNTLQWVPSKSKEATYKRSLKLFEEALAEQAEMDSEKDQ